MSWFFIFNSSHNKVTLALAKSEEQWSVFMFCNCSSRLATLFDDKFHVGQCSALCEIV